MKRKYFVFLLNLLQDVNVVRPLALLAAADFDAEIAFLVSDAFLKRDRQQMWRGEIDALAGTLRATVVVYDTPYAAFRFLAGKEGLLIAGSESDLPAHAQTHEVVRTAPSTFLKITLQHGFECVGLLQNEEQTVKFGASVRFAADVVCGWAVGEALTSIAASERSKLYVTGPQAVLLRAPASPAGGRPGRSGLVCENMHSVRFSIDDDRPAAFIEDFRSFCAMLDERGDHVTLRPHPGGQYVLRNDVQLPGNVLVENAPMYRVDLAGYAFGISAPSTVVLDMVLAGVPVGLWAGAGDVIDRRNYRGLRTIRNAGDWLAFADEVSADPEPVRREQADFLDRLRMPTDPGEVRARFGQLFGGGGVAIQARSAGSPKPFKALFIANDVSPSLVISFLDPLDSLDAPRAVESTVLTEAAVTAAAADPHGAEAAAWVADGVARHAPDIVVLCRYSGPQAGAAIAAARAAGIPTIYHLDDDLLHVPLLLGRSKHAYHNAPDRIASVTAGLRDADLIYCSTDALKRRMTTLGFDRPMVAGTVYRADEVRRSPVRTLFGRIGYMGTNHTHDMMVVLPAIVRVLEENPGLRFEIFGPMPRPAALDKFGDRVTTIAAIRNYDEFQAAMSALEWDVGICPLADTPFNLVKADTKWVDYTAVGIAVVASADTVYDRACADGCGILADGTDEWATALLRLCTDAQFRHEQVLRAQEKLRRDYRADRLRDQILAVFDQARDIAAARRDD